MRNEIAASWRSVLTESEKEVDAVFLIEPTKK
jgi:hypothetical protein